jgi:hypothetical protein
LIFNGLRVFCISRDFCAAIAIILLKL